MLRWRLVTHVDPCRVDLVATVLGGVSGEPGWVTSACRIEHLVPRRRRTEVDGSAFDRLARATATGTGRRSMLKSAAALLLAAAGITSLHDPGEIFAKKKGGRKKKPGTCNPACGECKTCVKSCRRKNGRKKCSFTCTNTGDGSGCSVGNCLGGICTPSRTVPPPPGVPPPPPSTRLVNQPCTPGVDQCVSGDANQPVLTCGLKNTEQQCNSTVAEIPGPTACCVPLGQPCLNNVCQCCGTSNPNEQTYCDNPGPVGTCAIK